MAERELSVILRVIREPETLTIFVNERHLKPVIREKLMKGLIDPYNIGVYSLGSMPRATINAYKPLGYKAVFTFDNKNILLIYNK